MPDFSTLKIHVDKTPGGALQPLQGRVADSHTIHKGGAVARWGLFGAFHQGGSVSGGRKSFNQMIDAFRWDGERYIPEG